MSTCQRQIYISENGDRWLLCREEGGRVYVLHEQTYHQAEPLQKSKSAFLSTGKRGPEHQSLLRLIGELTLAS
jgi:hypothetical protein